jgi:hypothetical protein
LNLSSEKLVSKAFAFSKRNLYNRYAEGVITEAMKRLDTSAAAPTPEAEPNGQRAIKVKIMARGLGR